MRPFVFLGGTVGRSTWRGSFVARLIGMGVPAERIHDPVAAEWTAVVQADEDAVKRDAEYVLLYICGASGYSLLEAAMGLYDRPESTVVVFDLNGLDGHVLNSLMKCERDLRARFPAGNIFSSADEALTHFSKLMGIRVKGAN